jgi:hypothetical protein
MSRVMVMKRIIPFTAAIALCLLSMLAFSAKASAFTPNLVLDDAIMDNTGAMNVESINAFLNGFPSSCLSTNNGFSAPDPTGYSPSTGFTYGGNVSGGRVIFDAAMAYSINPQVLLATLQKESSVVSGDASYHCQYINTSMGYGCPDSGSCPTNPATMSGFSKQVIHAAWLLKFGEQRSKGNTSWNVQTNNSPVAGDHWDNSDDPPTCYGGPMTQGSFKRCSSDSAPVFYDGYSTIDGASTHMDSGSTAALYWYTPHFSGNQHFVDIFTQWFGGTVSSSYFACHNGSNANGIPSGAQVIANKYDPGQADRLSLTFVNNTGSKCAEIHTWNYGYQNWLNNIPTNLYPLNPAEGQIISGNTYDDNRDEMMLIKTAGTGSGNVEVHTWKPGYQGWLTNIATNLPTSVAANGQVISGDTNGDGRDELIFVMYRNTGSGKVEVHTWNPGYQNWSTNIATNLPTADSDNGTVIAGKVGGQDRLMFVKSLNTAGGKVEIHTWNPGYQNWSSNIVTNLSGADLRSNGKVLAIDDRLAYVKYSNTGGKVEIHTWNPGYQSFYTDIASNQLSW